MNGRYSNPYKIANLSAFLFCRFKKIFVCPMSNSLIDARVFQALTRTEFQSANRSKCCRTRFGVAIGQMEVSDGAHETGFSRPRFMFACEYVRNVPGGTGLSPIINQKLKSLMFNVAS
jgi:hypothetical protein